jgi:DNA-binding CsgD family transcriptional regulator
MHGIRLAGALSDGAAVTVPELRIAVHPRHALFERTENGMQALIREVVHDLENDHDETIGGAFALSPSELRVASATIRGLDTKSVARRLCISVKTVEHHLTSIYRKADVRTRHELAAKVIAHLVPTGPVADLR